MKNQIDWQNLNYFIYLAKYQRLNVAASHLNSTPSTVSRRVKALEEEMGVQLFKTTPLGHELTPQGERLFSESQEIDDRIRGISRKMMGAGEDIQGSVLLTTVTTFAATLMPSILKKVKKTHPALEVNIISSKEFFNLSKREADIALRPTQSPPNYLIGRRVGKTKFALYASKKYLKENPVQDLPLERKSHWFIDLESSLGHLQSKKWLDEFTRGHNKRFIADSVFTSIFYCKEGLGIAALPTYLEIYFPQLIPIYTPIDSLGSDIWVLSHKDSSNIPRVRVLTEALYKETKSQLKDHLIFD